MTFREGIAQGFRRAHLGRKAHSCLGMDEDVRLWAAKVPSQEEEMGQEQGEQNMSSRLGSSGAHQCVLLAGAA